MNAADPKASWEFLWKRLLLNQSDLADAVWPPVAEGGFICRCEQN